MSRSNAKRPGIQIAEQSSHSRNKRERTSSWRTLLKRQVALSFLAVAAVVSTGCHNPFKCFQYRHTSYDFCGEPNTAYYYYPKGGWAVPSQQSKHCPTTVEAPFHGFAATCWTQWPEPWDPCPPPGMHPPAYPGEVIETPQHSMQAPQHVPAPMPMPVPTPPAVPPNQGAQELPQVLTEEELEPTPAARREPRASSTPVEKPKANAAPSIAEPVSSPLALPAISAPVLAAPAPAKPVATANKPTNLMFHGRHGFSGAEPAENSSAAVIELPVRKASASEAAPKKKSESPAQQIRSYIQARK